MKKYIVAFIVYSGTALLGCEDTSHQNVKVANGIVQHYKTIGEQIPFETGMQWIDIYNEKKSSSTRTELFGQYEISDSKVTALINSVDEFVGMAFHYGTDASGQKHIIVIPVDNTMRLWTSIPGRLYVDANTGNEISQSTAAAWAQNYKTANPSRIWFHFFGADIFDEIVAVPFFNSIDIQPALSELFAPQMLLIVWNEAFSFGGRTAWDDPGNVYDASNPCPHCDVE